MVSAGVSSSSAFDVLMRVGRDPVPLFLRGQPRPELVEEAFLEESLDLLVLRFGDRAVIEQAMEVAFDRADAFGVRPKRRPVSNRSRGDQERDEEEAGMGASSGC